MSLKRGDIVYVYFDLPYSKETKMHPAIIISNEDVYNTDEIYICVMMTSTTKIDSFSFEITQDMLQRKNNKDFSQARCHLISYIKDSHIHGYPVNTLRKFAVDMLIQQINEVSFEDY